MTTVQTVASALWFLPFTIPIAVWVAWSDMATMKIPNKAVMALVAVFAVVGLIALPLEAYVWRWAHLAVVLVAGFIAATLGLLGAGDAKFAAAMAPFVALGDIGMFLFLFAAVTIGGFTAHRIARATPAVRRATPEWESWTRKDFPMGLCLAGVLVFYLAIGAIWGV